MDKEVLREIWHGQLPVCFKLHPDDIDGMHHPEPYYMMVSRVTYFPLVLDRAVKYFNRFMDQNKRAIHDMWLDYDGQAIKWHHPIGLSWDLFGSSYELPWRLILHFSDFPEKELVRCNTKASIETSFMSSIKEADALKHKGAIIKNMVKKDHTQLWSSLVNDKFDQFWVINKRLMERADNEFFRYIPFRLYLPDYTYVQKVIGPCTVKRQIFEITEKTTIPPAPSNTAYNYDAEFVMNTLQNCSHKCTSSEDAQEGNASTHRCSTMLDLIQTCFLTRMDDLLIQRPDEDSERDENDLIDVKLFKYRFISHGIEIPFDTPLQWLSEHFSYPDNFLHICAIAKEASDWN